MDPTAVDVFELEDLQDASDRANQPEELDYEQEQVASNTQHFYTGLGSGILHCSSQADGEGNAPDQAFGQTADSDKRIRINLGRSKLPFIIYQTQLFFGRTNQFTSCNCQYSY